MLTAQLCDAKYCIAKAEQLFVPPNNEVIFYQAVQSRNTEPASWEIIVYMSPICTPPTVRVHATVHVLNSTGMYRV